VEVLRALAVLQRLRVCFGHARKTRSVAKVPDILLRLAQREACVGLGGREEVAGHELAQNKLAVIVHCRVLCVQEPTREHANVAARTRPSAQVVVHYMRM
jgi:hypothetical protein